ncbi:hypothetical protein RYR30_001957 [Flavobacterium psychrophilum]|nr:hypothetical protein [Flavobacterium psychrophilum]ELM3671996.1 hypothetical protein [Flavobacterium psychrophilum]ELM3727160.1 hypothetical protein [Flavobacterium psychrophilum]
MTKQEIILEKYNDYPNLIKHIKEDNGWCGDKFGVIWNKYKNNDLFDIRNNDYGTNGTIRPKSLQGIENNNGWINIENEKDLPKVGDYDMSTSKLMYWTNGGQYEANDYKKWVLHYPHLEISHYQFIPIIKLNEPLY